MFRMPLNDSVNKLSTGFPGQQKSITIHVRTSIYPDFRYISAAAIRLNMYQWKLI